MSRLRRCWRARLPFSLALMVFLLSTPTRLLAQQVAGLVVFVRGHVVVIRAGSSTAVGLKLKDDILVGDQIVTGEASQLLVALSPSSRLRLGRLPQSILVFQSVDEPSLNVGPETTLTIKSHDGRMELVVDKGWISYGTAKKGGHGVVAVRTADALAHVSDGSLWAYVDPRVPQVTEGSLVSMTNLCGGGPAVTGGTLDGRWVYLREGDCLVVVNGTAPLAQPTVYKRYDPGERWVLLREVAGTGRWSDYVRQFATSDDCKTAAAAQHAFGRIAECRQMKWSKLGPEPRWP